MTTEESIVYQLLNIIRGSELNNDEVVDERRIRSLMRVQRAEILYKVTSKGAQIPDVCFQKLAPTILSKLNDNEYIATLPGLIYLPNNFGIRITTPQFANIPLVNQEEYELSKRNPVNQYKPKATIQDQTLKIFVNGVSPSALDGGSRANATVQSIQNGKLLSLSVVLDNPDNGYNYNWTTSEYPLPMEYVAELKNAILRRDFQIMLSTKSDQIPNAKNDTLRYHDQGAVQ